MSAHIKAILAIQDKRKEQAREEKDRRVAACWEQFKDFDRNSIWGPCGGPRIEWQGNRETGEASVITTRPLDYLFDLDCLSICLTHLSEEGLWCEETLREVYDRAKEHNEVIQERDMTEYDDSPPSWWTEPREGEE
jgi:hypothetical protein